MSLLELTKAPSLSKKNKYYNISKIPFKSIITNQYLITALLIISEDKIAYGTNIGSFILASLPELKTLTTVDKAHSLQIMYLENLSDNRLISCSWDYLIKIWKINKDDTCELLHTIGLHRDIVMKVIAISNGRFASCSFDRTIKLFREDTYECVLNIKDAHSNYIKCIIQLSSGVLVSGSKDLKFWNIDNDRNYNCIHTMDNTICYNTETLYQISSYRILLGQYKSILIINVITYQIETTIFNSEMSLNTSFTVINDGSLLCANDNKTIYQYALSSYELIAVKPKSHFKSITSIKSLPCGMFISSSYDGSIKLWQYCY